MTVIGGTYHERVLEPQSTDLFGSGLRASSILAGCCPVTLHTSVEADSLRPLQAICGAYGFEVVATPRQLPVGFSYYTSVSPPIVDGTNQDLVDISVEGSDPTLVFGTIEANVAVKAPIVTYDPQRPRGPKTGDLERIEANRLAIVANQSEIRSLGRQKDIESAVSGIYSQRPVDIIVVKRGPLGVTIFERDLPPTNIGPFMTQSVWPIGSGDVFSAAFAWAWSVAGVAPVSAATIASAATAYYCSTRRLDLHLLADEDPTEITKGIYLKPRQEKVKAYLAGPFFSLGQRWLIEQAYQALRNCGADVFSPYHDVGRGGDEVATKDLQGLVAAEVVLGLLDGADAGTLFEIGYAKKAGKQVVGFADDPNREDFKMLRGLDVPIISDLATAVYRCVWSAMERA